MLLGIYTSVNQNSNILGGHTFNSIDNTIIGTSAAFFNTGNDNVLLGAFTDAYTNPNVTGINNSVAIGYKARAVNSNQFILGNNAQFVGVGLSNDPAGPQWNLEIATENTPAGFPGLGHGTATTANPYGGTGFSGLKFRDLTSVSAPCTTNPGGGVLALDQRGNVIYVPASGSGTSNGAGYCATTGLTPLTIAPGAGYNLNNAANFYFAGNGSHSLANNNVAIGKNCVTPVAKLDVLQASGTTLGLGQNSIGINVENDDIPTGPCPTVSGYPFNQPEVTGLNCYVPGGLSDGFPVYIGGIFNVPSKFCNETIATNFSIWVPPSTIPGTRMGLVNIGYPLNSIPGYNGGVNMAVNGFIDYMGSLIPSDSLLKTNINPINHGLDVIRQIQPVSYQYNGKAGTPTQGIFYGLIAEQLARVAPYAVDSSLVHLDSTNTLTNILSIRQEAVTYTAINAIKQLDAEVNGGTTGMIVADSTGTLYKKTDSTTAQLTQVGANSFAASADARYKTSITAIPNALGIVDSLNGVYFNWKQAQYPWKHFPPGQQIGFIAQQVQPFAPQVVTTDDSGYYSLDYGRITPLLVDAIKQQQDSLKAQKAVNNSQQLTIDSLRTTLNSIEACISSLCDDTARILGGNNTQNVTLSNAAILYQNTPNPFGTGGTKINYYLPQGTTGASIVFFDQYGNKLSQVPLTQTGMGSINVNPNRLSNGIYTYSLIINGTVNDTKKMVFSK